MGVAIWLTPKKDSDFLLGKVLWLFVAYALLHAPGDFLDMWVITGNVNETISLAGQLLTYLSYLFLFEFGRRLVNLGRHIISWWILPILVAGVVSVAVRSHSLWTTADVLIGYVIRFPGGVMASLGFFCYYEAQKNILKSLKVRKYFLAASISLLAWAFFCGLVRPEADFFPANWLNIRTFEQTTSTPVYVFRSLAAVVLTWAIPGIMSIFHLRTITMLKEAQTRLERQASELEVKNAQLHELNAGKDKFFSIIAHDLRSPFNALLCLTEIISERFDSLPADKLKEYLAKLRLSSERLYDLLENLLTWSLLQRGLMEYRPKVFDLSKIANEIVELFISNAEQKNITLVHSVPSEIQVSADYAMVSTVVRNLVSNALKFTNSGGAIKVSAQASTSRLVEIAVEDNGTGMNAEDLEKLFRIDVQHTNAGTAGEQGTGLGLHLCKDLIERNGGKLWVESLVGKGTIFRFTLPAATTDQMENLSNLAENFQNTTVRRCVGV